jgi:hypothetical protein
MNRYGVRRNCRGDKLGFAAGVPQSLDERMQGCEHGGPIGRRHFITDNGLQTIRVKDQRQD